MDMDRIDLCGSWCHCPIWSLLPWPQPATGHSLWPCLWHSNAIGRGRYLQEETPGVAAGGGSLVKTWLGLQDLIIQASLGLSCMEGKFRSASCGIVDLMNIWAAPQRQSYLWRLSGTTHSPSERCHRVPASLPMCGAQGSRLFLRERQFCPLIVGAPSTLCTSCLRGLGDNCSAETPKQWIPSIIAPSKQSTGSCDELLNNWSNICRVCTEVLTAVVCFDIYEAK